MVALLFSHPPCSVPTDFASVGVFETAVVSRVVKAASTATIFLSSRITRIYSGNSFSNQEVSLQLFFHDQVEPRVCLAVSGFLYFVERKRKVLSMYKYDSINYSTLLSCYF